MTIAERIVEQLIQGLGAVLLVLPMVFAAWICKKGERK